MFWKFFLWIVGLFYTLSVIVFPMAASQYLVRTSISNAFPRGFTLVRDTLGNFHCVYYLGLNFYYAKSTDQGQTWTETELATDEAIGAAPSLSLDSQNDVHVAWQGIVGAGSVRQIHYKKSTSGTWGSTTVLTSDTITQGRPAINVDSADNVHIVWAGVPAPTAIAQIRYIKYSGGSWSGITNLTSDTFNQSNPFLSIDSADDLHVVWDGRPTGDVTLRTQIRYIKYSGGSWSGITNLTSNTVGNQNGASIIADAQDNLHVVWRGATTVTGFYPRYIRYTTSWEAIFNLSTTASSSTSIMSDSLYNLYAIYDKSTDPKDIYVRKYTEASSTWESATNLTGSIAEAVNNPSALKNILSTEDLYVFLYSQNIDGSPIALYFYTSDTIPPISSGGFSYIQDL
jgi:hypothetical protein